MEEEEIKVVMGAEDKVKAGPMETIPMAEEAVAGAAEMEILILVLNMAAEEEETTTTTTMEPDMGMALGERETKAMAGGRCFLGQAVSTIVMAGSECYLGNFARSSKVE